MTQIDRLKADGITGSGTKIAVIDTGVSIRAGKRVFTTNFLQRLSILIIYSGVALEKVR